MPDESSARSARFISPAALAKYGGFGLVTLLQLYFLQASNERLDVAVHNLQVAQAVQQSSHEMFAQETKAQLIRLEERATTSDKSLNDLSATLRELRVVLERLDRRLGQP